LFLAKPRPTDFERLHEFLREQNPAAAQRAVAMLADAMDSLNTMPERGRHPVSPRCEN